MPGPWCLTPPSQCVINSYESPRSLPPSDRILIGNFTFRSRGQNKFTDTESAAIHLINGIWTYLFTLVICDREGRPWVDEEWGASADDDPFASLWSHAKKRYSHKFTFGWLNAAAMLLLLRHATTIEPCKLRISIFEILQCHYAVNLSLRCGI